MAEQRKQPRHTIYEIIINGHLDTKWAEWLYDMTITHENDGTTTLYGPLPDQAALHNILLRIRDMNLMLINVQKINHSNLDELDTKDDLQTEIDPKSKKMNTSISNKPKDLHTLPKSFLLHTFPGILTTAAVLIFKPLIDAIGYPPLLAFLVVILLIDIPFMLGVMFNEGKKRNGRYSLEGVVLYREKVNWKTFAVVFIGAFVVLYLVIMLSSPLNSILADTLFPWLPEWFFFDNAAQYEGYAKNILILVFTLQLVITGVFLPWVEELYFRGYLLPRISYYGGWAPFIGGLLFGLYHGWQLYGWVGVSLLGAGLGYVVWWKKDLRLSISLHIFANAVVRLVLLMSVLAM